MGGGGCGDGLGVGLATEQFHLELHEALLLAELELRVLVDDADGLVALACLVFVVVLLSVPVAPVAGSERIVYQ